MSRNCVADRIEYVQRLLGLEFDRAKKLLRAHFTRSNKPVPSEYTLTMYAIILLLNGTHPELEAIQQAIRWSFGYRIEAEEEALPILLSLPCLEDWWHGQHDSQAPGMRKMKCLMDFLISFYHYEEFTAWASPHLDKFGVMSDHVRSQVPCSEAVTIYSELNRHLAFTHVQREFFLWSSILRAIGRYEEASTLVISWVMNRLSLKSNPRLRIALEQEHRASNLRVALFKELVTRFDPATPLDWPEFCRLNSRLAEQIIHHLNPEYTQALDEVKLAGGLDPLQVLLSKEEVTLRNQWMEQTLSLLAGQERKAAELCRRGKSFVEIASELGWKPGAVRSMFSSRIRLKAERAHQIVYGYKKNV